MRNILTAFKEHKEFNKDKPWSATVFSFETEIITPPHYAETIEILAYDGVAGDAHIGGQHFTISGRRAYFVAPNVVHAMYYKPCDGHSVTMKINVNQLKPIFDIEAFLSYHNLSYADLPIYLPDFDEVKSVADTFINETNLSSVLIAIIKFFKLLIAHASASDEQIHLSPHNDSLRSIVEWTEKNFMEKISLETVSQQMGYNKNYFCRKFKTLTGITYLTYLNNTRIYHALKLLKSGYSVSDTCIACGFDDLSYFTQLFKKIMNVTPSAYCKQIKNSIE